jgi:hypothetical protein
MRQQYIEHFPIPRNIEVAAEIQARLSSQVDKNEPAFKDEINRAVYRLYDLTKSEIAFIKDFNAARFETINNR